MVCWGIFILAVSERKLIRLFEVAGGVDTVLEERLLPFVTPEWVFQTFSHRFLRIPCKLKHTGP